MSDFKYRINDIVYFQSLNWECTGTIVNIGEVIKRASGKELQDNSYGPDDKVYWIQYTDKEKKQEYIAVVFEQDIFLDTLSTMKKGHSE